MITLDYLQQFRLVKIQLATGAWKTMNRVYYTTAQLEKDLAKYDGLKGVFSSCSLWRNPLALELNTPDEPTFLKSDLVIDIDDEDSPDSFKQSLQVKNYLEGKKELTLIKHLRSGGGYHLKYKLPDVNIPEPQERMAWYGHYKQAICEELVAKGFTGIDYGRKGRKWSSVSADILRVTRMEGSPHPSGETCREVKPTMYPDFESKHDVLMREPRPEYPAVLPILDKAASPYSIRYAITNNVLGMKDAFVTYLEKANNSRSLFLIRSAQETYGLGNVYLFMLPKNKLGALSTKIMSFDRLCKVMKAVDSTNLKTFEKYKQVWIPVADVHQINGKLIKSKYHPSKVMHSNISGLHSRQHAMALGITLPLAAESRKSKLMRKIQIMKQRGTQ